MKLVNPVGRDVSTFETQANSGCHCVCHSGSSNTRDKAAVYGTACGCNCSPSIYGNDNANYTIAYNAAL